MIKKQLAADGEESKRFSDEQTDKRIHEVLTNENDGISEQDIKNVRTDVNALDPVSPPRNIDPSDKNSAENKETEEEKKELEEKEIKDDTDPRIDNDSWNILEGSG